ncbi:MAG: HNH endonuclease [Culicoidibacterales bacterium]
MMNWILSANLNVYNHEQSFAKNSFIDWKKTANFEVGDIIYIYVSKPVSAICFVGKVTKIDMDFTECIDDREFWMDETKYEAAKDGLYNRIQFLGAIDSEKASLEILKEKGLKAAPQRPMRIKDVDLAEYLQKLCDYRDNNGVVYYEVNEEKTNLDQALAHLKESKITFSGVKKLALAPFINEQQQKSYQRDASIAAKSIAIANYQCEIDNNHPSFIRRTNNENYTEAHHLIPMNAQGDFKYSLDIEENIVSLCSNCHNCLHYNQRKVLLEQVGLQIEFNDLKKYYQF